MTYKLILLRHGQSTWNKSNQFTGWMDVQLTDLGREEGSRAGELLAQSGLLPDIQFTSLLRRAIHTANLALEVAERDWIDVKRSWRLNERHYGALQGLNKAETLEKYGEEQFMAWRRSFDSPPPPIDDDSEFSQAHDPRYAGLGDDLPRTECLKDVIERMLPYWEADIQPELSAGKTGLVAAPGNSLRAVGEHPRNLSDFEVSGLDLPTGLPLGHELGEDFLPERPAVYLDPEAAAAGAAAVASQGKK